METTVYKRLPVQFNMCGQVVARPVEKTSNKIGSRLCARILDYASERARGIGIPEEVMSWAVEIYTMDHDSKVDERWYTVRWSNKKGAKIELCGILIKNGRPFIDHRFSLTED